MGRFVGSLGDSGCPVIRIRVEGTAAIREFDAIVDTGFNGFLVLPIMVALPIGLTLTGTISSHLADGTESLQYTAKVNVSFGSESHMGTAMLPYDGDVLVGMRFLESFRQSLVIDRDQVLLIDQDDLDADLLH